MIRTLIVDDDALVRATLRTLLHWEEYGYLVVQDCNSGAQALDYLYRHPVDLMITDMKMPGMGGIELLQRLRGGANVPVTVALSGYDEFDLAREAFRLGAYDYLLKDKLDRASLARLLTDLRGKVFVDRAGPAEQAPGPGVPLEAGEYAVAVLAVQDYSEAAQRFGGDLTDRLQRPMLELARQIPRLNGRGTLRALNPGCYELYYRVGDKAPAREAVLSVARQIQQVWRDYMNLQAAVGVNGPVPHTALPAAAARAAVLCRLAALRGPGGICTQWADGPLADTCEQRAAELDALAGALLDGDAPLRRQQTGAFFALLSGLAPDEGRRTVLALLARLNGKLESLGFAGGVAALAGQDADLIQTVQGIRDPRELELWLRNALRRGARGLRVADGAAPADPIAKARAFMQDNFTNPELTLKTVADYVGFNEKYFSTRFAKECGCTFIVYLNRLRIDYAQQLLRDTDLRMYEISERAGYNNVEHFNHIFKKKLGVSPSDYRKSPQNN